MLFDLLDRVGVDQRALGNSVFGAVADLHRLGLGRELLDKGVVDLVLGIDAIGADAGLAHVAEFRDHGAFDRGIEIGVIEHDERRVAAEFEAELLHADRGLPIKNLAHFGRAGETDHAHRRMLAQHLADGSGLTGQHVEHTLREAGLLGQRSQRQRGQRGFGGGLEHHGAARGQRRRNLAGDHGAGEIPGRDGAGHPDRLADCQQTRIAARRGNGLAIDALGFLGIELDEGGGIGDLAAGLCQRLALLGGEDQREVIAIGNDQVEPFAQQHRALLRRGLRPGLEGTFRRFDRLGGFLGAKPGHADDGGAGGWIVDLDGGGADPGAVDETAVAQQRGIFQAVMQRRSGRR